MGFQIIDPKGVQFDCAHRFRPLRREDLAPGIHVWHLRTCDYPRPGDDPRRWATEVKVDRGWTPDNNLVTFVQPHEPAGGAYTLATDLVTNLNLGHWQTELFLLHEDEPHYGDLLQLEPVEFEHRDLMAQIFQLLFFAQQHPDHFEEVDLLLEAAPDSVKMVAERFLPYDYVVVEESGTLRVVRVSRIHDGQYERTSFIRWRAVEHGGEARIMGTGSMPYYVGMWPAMVSDPRLFLAEVPMALDAPLLRNDVGEDRTVASLIREG